MSEIITLAKKVVFDEITALQEMLERIDNDFEVAISIIKQCKGRVVVVGMGKSGHIGKKIAATLASTGTSAFFVHPAEAFHGDLGMIRPSDVILMISNSGETEELVRLIPFLLHQKNCLIAMTGSKKSTLACHSNIVLDVHVEREACKNNLAPTSSTTAALVMGDALAVVLSEVGKFQPEDFARFHPGGSLGRRLLMRVSDVMLKANLPICQPEDSFIDIVHAITRGRCGIALVLDGEKLVGVVTDGDLRRAFNEENDVKYIQAKNIMTFNPITIGPDEYFLAAEKKMINSKITTLVVKSQQDNVVGIVQLQDVITV